MRDCGSLSHKNMGLSSKLDEIDTDMGSSYPIQVIVSVVSSSSDELASIPTIDLHKLFDFRIKVSFATAFLVNTIEGPPVIFSRIFSSKFLSLEKNG